MICSLRHTLALALIGVLVACSSEDPTPSSGDAGTTPTGDPTGTGAPSPSRGAGESQTPGDDGNATPDMPDTPDTPDTPTPQPDAGRTPATCDASKTFDCAGTSCTLAQVCRVSNVGGTTTGACVDVPARDRCTPCSTQGAVVTCPTRTFKRVSGSSTDGCTVRCE
jgi:hypothetical protein